MKKAYSSYILTTLALATGFATTTGQERTDAEMQSIASRFFQSTAARLAPRRQTNINSTSAPQLVARSSRLLGTDTETFVVFAPASGSGFVIVSATATQPAILGYSDTGLFDANLLPPAMKAFLSGTAANDPSAAKHLAAEQGITIEPLLGDIAFNQFTPYNDLCPVSPNNEITYTGCVATAAAQLMAFYRYPERMTGEDISYTTGSYRLPVTWPSSTTTFNWDNILPQYTALETVYEGTDTIGTALYMTADSIFFQDNDLYVTNFRNYSSETAKGVVKLILATTEGSLIRPLDGSWDFELGPRYGYTYWTFSTNIPGSIPDGEYRIYVGLMQEGTTQWSLTSKLAEQGNSPFGDPIYATVTKHGNTFTINGQSGYTEYTEAQGAEVAKLHAAVGAAIYSDYGDDALGGTSSNEILLLMGLTENFGYDDGGYVLNEWGLPTAEAVETALIGELQAGRPILCGGADSEDYGHLFVVDGVQPADSGVYFHFNWGWGGYDDGYYYLNLDESHASESSNDYVYDFTMLMEIKPDDGVASPSHLSCDSIGADQEQYFPGDPLTFAYNTIFNQSNVPFSGSITAYVVSDEDETSYAPTQIWNSTSYSMELNYGIYGDSNTLTLPEDIPDGTYHLEFRSLNDGFKEEVHVACGDFPTFIIGNSSRDDSEVTAIELLKTDAPSSTPSYTLDGRRIPANANFHGLRIRGGHIELVK
jgi:hypothetical protein